MRRTESWHDAAESEIHQSRQNQKFCRATINNISKFNSISNSAVSLVHWYTGTLVHQRAVSAPADTLVHQRAFQLAHQQISTSAN